MSFVKSLTEQLQGLWGEWSSAQRIGMVGGALLCLGGVAAVFFWAIQPDYTVLASQLTPQQAADMVGTLEDEKISAQMNFSGTSVSVPRSQYAQATLAVRNLLPAADGVSSDQDVVSSWLPTPDAEREQRKQNLERRLALSITKIQGIRSATVHLGQPHSSPFTIEQRPATASIIIDLGATSILPAQAAQSVVLLVARAVDGLAPEGVVLSDTTGRQYATNNSLHAGMNGQIEYQQRVETYLESKAVSMLSDMLGPGHASVRVSADIDFRELTREERTFDPAGKVKLSENTTTTSSSGRSPQASGAVGVDANSGSFLKGEADQSTFKSDVTDVIYDNATISETVRELPGMIRRLTIAAVVDLSKKGAAGAGAPTVSEQAIQEVLKTAVGFDGARDDSIQVVFAPLDAYADLESTVVAPPVWTQYTGLIEAASLGIAAFVAFILGVLVIRRLRPLPVSSGHDLPLSAEDIGRLATLSQQVRENPGVTASILNNWLHTPPSETSNQQRAA